ncbi:hypothetical protein IEQ34_024727 [Dendrobium chrysotoxum]|uniref:Translation initiation factor IF-1, chloroplastic n=1 Tax=Dendrobium chrysotoxum TaxID=161865 RepID=A0AAV7FRS0_DENCH|nr:hypothetical protein IEQ34_024727 [Dendrobium chrysotoxum]
MGIVILSTSRVETERGFPGMKEQKLIHEGFITESLPNGMFRVRENPAQFYTYTTGDRVKIEMSRYDSTRGRLIYRLRKKDSND